MIPAALSSLHARPDARYAGVLDLLRLLWSAIFGAGRAGGLQELEARLAEAERAGALAVFAHACELAGRDPSHFIIAWRLTASGFHFTWRLKPEIVFARLLRTRRVYTRLFGLRRESRALAKAFEARLSRGVRRRLALAGRLAGALASAPSPVVAPP